MTNKKNVAVLKEGLNRIIWAFQIIDWNVSDWLCLRIL